MKRFFITSSGTGIGKTFITCALTHQLRQQGIKVHALKPIISGWDVTDPTMDSLQLLDAMEKPHDQKNIEAISPWRFAAPLSPDMAAKKEGRHLELSDIVSFCQQEQKADICLIEGVGGVMVPLNDKVTVLDWITQLSYETVLVVGSYLGSISHTLTAYHALKSQGITIKAIIISETPESTVSLVETQATLSHFIQEQIISLPYNTNPEGWRTCAPLHHIITE